MPPSDKVLSPLHKRLCHRARVASWAAVPLFLLLGFGWFLFRIVNCQSGIVSALEHRVCEHSYLVPLAAFGFAMVFAGSRLALALGELGAAFVFSSGVLGEPVFPGETESRTQRTLRHLRHVGAGYRHLEEPHRSSVVFAMRMLAGAAGLMIGFLPYNYFYVFPPLLGVLTAAAVPLVVWYLSRNPAPKGTPRSTPTAQSTPDNVPRSGPMAPA